MVNEVVESHELSGSNPSINTLGFFPSVLALVDGVTWHMMPVGGGSYPVELVEACES